MKVQIGKIGKSVLFTFFLITIISGTINPIFAGSNSFGISPASIYNTVLLKGSHFEQDFIISRANPNTSAVATITIKDKKLNELITFEPGTEIALPAGKQRVTFKALIDIPEDVDMGIYKGNIHIVMKQSNAQGQVVLLPAVALSVNLVVGDENIADLKIQTISIPDVLQGNDVVFDMKALNTGNIPARPGKLEVEFQTISQTHYSYFVVDTFDDIGAFSEMEQSILVSENTLAIGDYFAIVTVFDENSEEIHTDKLSFSVVKNDSPNSAVDTFTKQLRSIAPIYLYIVSGLLFLLLLIILRKRKNKQEEEY